MFRASTSSLFAPCAINALPARSESCSTFRAEASASEIMSFAGLRGQEKIEIAINYKISTQSGELNALDVAGNCMNAWDIYLKSNNASA
jgi:hypothetical protein